MVKIMTHEAKRMQKIVIPPPPHAPVDKILWILGPKNFNIRDGGLNKKTVFNAYHKLLR